jgi:dihydrofolate synthase/folylpolyglutamate synthase
LGDTIEEIAGEKAGIIKPGAIVVCGQQQPAAMKVIQRKAEEVGAALLIQDRDFGVSERSLAIGGQLVSIRGIGGYYDEIVLPLHGEHQAHNAALALAAVEAFFGAGIDGRALDSEVVREGFGKATSPARLEVVRRGPTVIVDAAHNPHGAHALVQAIDDEFSFTKIVFVLAMFADKDSLGFISEIEPLADHVIVTQAVSPRALNVDELYAQAATILEEEILEKAVDLPSALERAIEIADETTATSDESVGIIVTGSVVTAAQARALLGKKRA